MDTRIVPVYCMFYDMLKALHHRDDPQCQMTDAGVMTTVSVAALDYGGNLEKARRMPQTEGYFPNMLGKSRFKSGIFYLTCSKEDCLNGVEIYDDLRLTQRVIGYIPIGEECQSKVWYDGSS